MKNLLLYSMFVALAAACIIGLWRLRSLAGPYIFILVQLITALVIEIAGKYFVPANTGLYNVYILQELVWLCLAGRLWLNDSFFKNVVALCLFICIVIWCVNMYSIKGKPDFANKAFLSNCIMITGLYIAVMLQTANRTKHIVRHPLFWLCLAHILYFGCVIPYFSLYDYFTYENIQAGKQLYVINDTVAVIRYALIAYVFWQQGRWADESKGSELSMNTS